LLLLSKVRIVIAIPLLFTALAPGVRASNWNAIFGLGVASDTP
jgi:hypothetical protein